MRSDRPVTQEAVDVAPVVDAKGEGAWSGCVTRRRGGQRREPEETAKEWPRLHTRGECVRPKRAGISERRPTACRFPKATSAPATANEPGCSCCADIRRSRSTWYSPCR